MILLMDDEQLLVSEVFNRAGLHLHGRQFAEDSFASTCLGCGTEQLLSEARKVDADPVGLITAYRCKQCGAVLVETGHWGFRQDKNRTAYRLKDYAVYMTAGLQISG